MTAIRWNAQWLLGLILIAALAVPGVPMAAAQEGGETIEYRIQTPDYILDGLGVHVSGYAVASIPGAPQLPVKGLLIELPLEGAWQVSHRSEGNTVLLQSVYVAPAPSPDLDLNLPEGWANNLDALPSAVPVVSRSTPAIYQANAFYPASPVVVGQAQRQGDKRLLPIQVFPFQYNPVTRQLRYHPDVVVTVQVQPTDSAPAPTSYQPDGFYQATSLPGEGVLRIHTREQGLYRLAYEDLENTGMALGADGEDPASFAIYYKGQQVDIEVTGADDDSFDPGDLVIFYALPYDGGRFQDYNIYHFVYGDGVTGQRMAERPVTAVFTPTVASVITQTLHVEYNRDYRSLYPRPSDADHFFDTQLYANISTPTVTRSYDLALDDPVTNAGFVGLSVLVHGGIDQTTDPDQSLLLRLNTHDVGLYQWNGRTDNLITASVPAAWLDGAPNRVYLVAALSQLPNLPGSNPYYWISPDWVRVSYPALADAENDRIFVEGLPGVVGQVAVTGFTTSTVSVLDVRDPSHPLRLDGVAAQSDGSAFVLYWQETVDDPTYVASSQAALLVPGAIERDVPSNWADPSHAYDYVAIVGTERSYGGTTALGAQIGGAVQPLLDYRAAEGFSVARVEVQDIYDEWSHGRIDPMAIRSFLSYAYHNWQTPPRYVLLVGDGHYDYNRVTTQRLPMVLPPYLLDIDPFVGETAADNRYVSVDSPADYLPNMTIGRFPVVSASNVTAMVDKIRAYESETTTSGGLWQQRSVYIADNYSDPAGNFHQLSDNVRLDYLPTAFESRRVYYRMDPDHDTGTEMRAAIRATLDQGALFAQWFGHASTVRWGSVSMWNILDLPSLQPNLQLPLTMHNACWSGYFVLNTANGDGQSLGETFVLTPGRGSIVDFSPTGLHVGSALLTLDQGMHVGLFQERTPRAGDVADYSRFYFFQNSFTWHDVIDTMIFFGDPALKLRYPTGDLASSSLEVSDAVAPLGASLSYTLTISNTSIFTTSQPLVTVDYPQGLVAVVEANGAVNNGDTLAWTLPDLPAASQQMVTFTLRAENMPPPESYDLAVPAAVSSQMAPSVALEAHTQILTPPDALASGLAVQREWLSPGFPVTATLTLTHSGDLPAPGVLVTMTLPAEIGAPTWLSATTSSLIYDPVAHRITWSGDAPAGSPTLLGFSSVISPSLAACTALPLDAAVFYGDAVTSQSAMVNLVMPDVDCSGSVTVADIQQVAARWGSQAGDPLYHPRYDLDADDAIDVFDITAAAQVWN